MRRYIVLRSKDPEELARSVNGFLERGAELVGGICVTKMVDFMGDGKTFEYLLFSQAVIETSNVMEMARR